MEIELQKRMVMQIIDQQFMPEVIANIEVFLKDYHHKVQFETEYRIITGYSASYPSTPSLDLRPAQERLLQNIFYAISNPKN